MHQTIGLTVSAHCFLLIQKRCLLFKLLLLVTWGSVSIGFLPPHKNRMGHGFTKGNLVPLQKSIAALIHSSTARNSGEENSEEMGDTDPSNGSDNFHDDDDDDDDDDTVQTLPVAVPRDHIVIPRQLSRDLLSSIVEKKRRTIERSLLEKIQQGDDAIWELRDFWRSQSGSSREEELLNQAANGIGDPSSWENSKDILEGLCAENPTFLQPFALLSKLYCLMGRLEDSQTIALEVLKLKPWHFLAIETMVATSYALNQINTSVYWASRRMPPPSQSEKRKEWIDHAIKKSLDFEDELVSMRQIEEEESDYDGNIEYLQNEDEDTWQ
mmetsp:Transcript_18571/g.40434  ORF Transcript_18571/g.40434 Transcript_18571/m.40434 type:complete len:326 (-) Transcript_18571:1532-2509(-)